MRLFNLKTSNITLGVKPAKDYWKTGPVDF